MTTKFYSVFLLVHVICGAFALLTGALAMFSKKGSHVHKKAGVFFFISMCVVGVTALILSTYSGKSFLSRIGIFALYQTICAYRAVKIKSLKPGILEYLVFTVGFTNTILMLVSLNPILLVFGVISLFLLSTQLRVFYYYAKKKKLPDLAWLRMHLGMFVGSYISAATAFLVNVKIFGPTIWIWFLPTIFLAPLIRYWSKKYTSGLNKISTDLI